MRATSSPHIHVREDWLALRSEEILEPELPIIDAHHHLWDRPGALYLFGEFLADIRSGHRILASVYAQCRSMYRGFGPVEMRPVGEVEFVNGVAAQSASGLYGSFRACAAIVGFADLMLGDKAAPVLDALIQAGNGRLRGVRNTTAWHEHEAIRSNPQPPPPGLLASDCFRRGVRHLSTRNLSLDVWAYHTQLAELVDLVRQNPDLRVIVDHVGGPLGAGPYAGRRDEVFAEWKARMTELAALPRVCVKLGGLGMNVSGFAFHERAAPPSSQELAEAWKPYIQTCIDLFGPDRCMFESNFPVDKGMFSYPVLWNAFKRITRDFSASEKASLYSGAAASVYRLTPAEIGATCANEPN
ncbi:MAG: amidohydrolase family protein [Hyphomicrobiales bacterium]|nr:amidohydrolase family protein [Hyphomicrobiales bacterium]